MIFLMFISSKCITSPRWWTRCCFSVAAFLSLFQLFMYFLFSGLLAGSTAQADLLLHPFRSFITPAMYFLYSIFIISNIFVPSIFFPVFFFMFVSVAYILISLFLLRIFFVSIYLAPVSPFSPPDVQCRFSSLTSCVAILTVSQIFPQVLGEYQVRRVPGSHSLIFFHQVAFLVRTLTLV